MRQRGKIVAAALAVAIVVSAAGCESAFWKRRFGKRPNVLLLSVDALRADRLGAYGDAAARTPAVDGLAARGVLFEEAIASATWTQPSVAAMLTGRWPAALAADQKGETTQSLHAREETLAESFAAKGYATAAFVDNGTLAPEFGYAQGFETYFNVNADDGESVTKPAIGWLKGHAGRPFFVWVHWLDPHEPYVRRDYPPYAPQDDPRRAAKDVMDLPFYWNDNVQRDLGAHYDSEVAFMDRCLAMVLAALDEAGLRESTLVVFTADHGEALGESGDGPPRFGHGDPPYEDQVRVPLIVSWPGVVPAGKRVAGQRSNVDVAPTVRDLARVGGRTKDGGASLAGALFGDGGPGEDVTYSQSFQRLEDAGYPIHFAARTARYKLFMRVNRVVPAQFARDAAGTYPFARRSSIPAAEFARIEAALAKYVVQWESGPQNISEELRQRLKAIGYLGGGTPATDTGAEGPPR